MFERTKQNIQLNERQLNLVASHLEWGQRRAKWYSTLKNIPEEDLQLVIMHALERAAKSFDETMNNKFATYANYYIRKAVQNYEKDMARVYLVGNEQWESLSNSFAEDFDDEEEVDTYDLWSQITMDSLTEREKYIILHFYGVYGAKKQKGKELAQDLGLSAPRVSQITRTALKKLRKENKNLINKAN